MRDDVKQELQRVVEEWRKTLQQMEATIAGAEVAGLSDDKVVRLLQGMMADGWVNSSHQLKLAHVLLIE